MIIADVNVPSDRFKWMNIVSFCRRNKETIILVVSLIVFAVGIGLIFAASGKKEGQSAKALSADVQRENGENETTKKPTNAKPTSAKPTSVPMEKTCAFSEEALRAGLPEFLRRVKNTYYKLHPYDVYYDQDVKTSTIREKYVAYDPTPSVIKMRTDTALDLLKEISNRSIDTDKLKPRERKSLAQVKHYLRHIFGQPYDVNYYAGDWMLGPNLFCWQEICAHGYGIYNGIGLYHKPYNASDVNLIETKLRTHKEGILQYIENLKMGVKSGMVRSVEECKAGLNAISKRYLNVSLLNETGNPFLKGFGHLACRKLHPESNLPTKCYQNWSAYHLHGKTGYSGVNSTDTAHLGEIFLGKG